MVNPLSSGISSPGLNPMPRKCSAIRVPKPFPWRTLTLEAMRRLLFHYFNFAGRRDLSFIFLESFAAKMGIEALEQSSHIFPHLMFPIRPIVAALRSPVVE